MATINVKEVNLDTYQVTAVASFLNMKKLLANNQTRIELN